MGSEPTNGKRAVNWGAVGVVVGLLSQFGALVWHASASATAMDQQIRALRELQVEARASGQARVSSDSAITAVLAQHETRLRLVERSQP